MLRCETLRNAHVLRVNSAFVTSRALPSGKTHALRNPFGDNFIILVFDHILIGVVAIFFIIGIFRLRVETNPVGYFKANTPVSRNFHDIYKDLSGSFFTTRCRVAACQVKQRQLPYILPPSIYNFHANQNRIRVLQLGAGIVCP
jgi:hypothetical protein